MLELELATTDEIVKELMKRSTFNGIIVKSLKMESEKMDFEVHTNIPSAKIVSELLDVMSQQIRMIIESEDSPNEENY